MFDFSEWWESLKNFFLDFMYDFINLLIELVAMIISLAASMLPSWDPISALSMPTSMYGALNALNWLFPVGFAVTMVQIFAWSTIAYFTIGALTRWAKITN